MESDAPSLAQAHVPTQVLVWRVPSWTLGSLQLLTTVLIVTAPVANAAKVPILLAWWLLTFWPLQLRELVFYALTCAFFTVMDVLTVGGGAFQFTHPDLLGLPWYEPFLWGFYLLHTMRMVGGAPPESATKIHHRVTESTAMKKNSRANPNSILFSVFSVSLWWRKVRCSARSGRNAAYLLAVLYALVFSFVREPQALTCTASALLVCGLALFRQPGDFAYAGYMILVGALIEYAGVWSGEWSYPGDPQSGVALWFIPLWGGIGVLLRRIGLPIISNPFSPNGIQYSEQALENLLPLHAKGDLEGTEDLRAALPIGKRGPKQ